MKRKETRILDNLWRKIALEKAGNRCEYCGITTRLNVHHIFSRSNRSVRWDLDNACVLCVSHHILGNFSAHKAPMEFAIWLQKGRGEKWYKKLRRKASEVCKPNFKAIKEDLEGQTKNLP